MTALNSIQMIDAVPVVFAVLQAVNYFFFMPVLAKYLQHMLTGSFSVSIMANNKIVLAPNTSIAQDFERLTIEADCTWLCGHK